MIDIPLIVDSIPKMLMGIGLTLQLLFLSGALGLALAVVLLLLCGRTAWIGKEHRNRPATVVVLLATIAFFLWTAFR